MKAEEFYKKQSKKGLTYDITCNPNPNYSQNFYQSIFRLMEEYAKQEVVNAFKHDRNGLLDHCNARDLAEDYFNSKPKNK